MVEFSDSDEGKPVKMDGEKVGMIKTVEHGTAYVDPDAGITDKIKAKLDWGERDEDTYPLQERAVDTITDDEIRLRSNL
ncbi:MULTISPECIES: PRC-barrel domain containing protein [Halorussus]|uniref:PRC-barrel domain containing protein n=1 Tax=Halorussus TaxID=1070314 RepID=UPI00209F06D5|nr:PRC-barrel domain containing protein [Halorussus vallis]USZ74415.1 PRC-barrel domain containing protein [Halorussus vallis]